MDIAIFPVVHRMTACGPPLPGPAGACLDWRGLAARFAAVHAAHDVFRGETDTLCHAAGSFDSVAAHALTVYPPRSMAAPIVNVPGAARSSMALLPFINLIVSTDGKLPGGKIPDVAGFSVPGDRGVLC